MNAADICAALDRRYNQVDGGAKAESWIAIREARSGAGFSGNNRQCDYLVINTWQGRGMQLIGHEVKVSKADWVKELGEPEKAEHFARYCRRWWVAMPSALATAVKDDVPPGWGLLSVSDAGRITELQKAPVREPEPVPAWWWIGWLAQIDRRQRRALRDDEIKARNEAVEALVELRMKAYERDHPADTFTRQDVLDLRNLRQWKATWDRLVEVAPDVARAADWDVQSFARLWKMRYQATVIDRARGTLEQTLKMLDELEGS